MEFKTSTDSATSIEDRIVEGYPSIFGNLDLGYDITEPGAFRKTLRERKGRIRHLWLHDFESPPTAAILDLREVKADELPEQVLKKFPEAKGGLKIIREYLKTPRGDEILEGLKTGAISEMSYGFDAVKVKIEEDDEQKTYIRHLNEVRLYDTSDVLWGMNELTVALKRALPFRDTGKAEKTSEWKEPILNDFTSEESFEDLTQPEKMRIAAHFAFSKTWPPETFEDLRFPHHAASKEGVGPVVWGGANSVISELMRIEGKADVSYSDRFSVYGHLAKHYEQYNMEIPDFKFVELVALSNSLSLSSFNVGRVLSDEEKSLLDSSIKFLTSFLTPAEPQIDIALTGVFQRLRKAQLEQKFVSRRLR